MVKKVTISDIAREANVSPASVSMILNKKSIARFAETTIDRVQTVAQTLGYNHCKKPITLQKDVIYIICPSIINPYYATIIQSIESQARKYGYHTAIFTTYWDLEDERYLIEKAINDLPAGLIFTMIPQQPQLATKLNKHLPVIAIGDRRNDLEIGTVDINNYNAGRLAAQHLLSLGHKHVAYISSTLNQHHSSRVRRCQGLQETYTKLCPEGSVTIYTQEVAIDVERENIDLEFNIGYNLTKECLKQSPHITALIAINDMVAYGILSAVKDAGLSVPEDISVCGFDNIYPSKFANLELTSVEHSIVECGRSAFNLLHQKIVSTTLSDTITRVEYISKLIPRQTTGAAKTSQSSL